MRDSRKKLRQFQEAHDSLKYTLLGYRLGSICALKVMKIFTQRLHCPNHLLCSEHGSEYGRQHAGRSSTKSTICIMFQIRIQQTLPPYNFVNIYFFGEKKNPHG